MTPETPGPDTLLAAIPFAAYPLSDDRCLLLTLDDGVVQETDAMLGRILGLCRGFRTFDEHLALVAGTLGIGRPEALRPTLEALVTTGLLRAAPTSSRHDTGVDSSVEVRTISAIGIVTADRTEKLRRCLTSFLQHCQKHERRIRFVVADGSVNELCRVANRECSRQLSMDFDVPVAYVGRDECAALQAALRDADVPAPDVEFALTRSGDFAAGANRNLLLLWTAGERILAVDDDVMCDVWSLPDTSDGVALAGHVDPRHGEFLRTRADVLAAIKPVETDLIAAHEHVLGATLPDLVARAPRIELNEACQHLVELLRENEAAIVRLAFAGIAGDSGVHCPYRLLFGQARASRRLSEDAAAYDVAVSSREGIRIADRYTITHDAACMAACVGLDNAALLPPFMPLGRNEDGVFGATVSLMDHRAISAHVPLGVIHDSGRPAEYGHRHIPSASETRLADVLLALYSSVAPAIVQGTTPSTRLRLLGTYLSALADLDRPAFRTWITRLLLQARSRDVGGGDAAECGEHWRAAHERYRRELSDAVGRPTFFAARECLESSVEDSFTATQRFVTRFGRLLVAWPAMWDVARRRNSAAPFPTRPA